MSERYENLEKAMCKELEKLDKKYTADVEMTEQDAERADKLYHALKSAATYPAMKDAGRRGRRRRRVQRRKPFHAARWTLLPWRFLPSRTGYAYWSLYQPWHGRLRLFRSLPHGVHRPDVGSSVLIIPPFQ